MQVIILAAGMGKRLRPLTNKVPKVMVKVAGKEMILHQLEAISSLKDISEIIIAVGYRKSMLKKLIGNTYDGIKVTYVENDIYRTTNNVYSLYLALKLVKEDILLLEGDVLFKPWLLTEITSNKNVIFIEKFTPDVDGVVVEVDPRSKVVKRLISEKDQKDGFSRENCFKTANIYFFTRDFIKKYYEPSLKFYIKSVGKKDFYELMIGSLIYMRVCTLHAHIVQKDMPWVEIDDIYDLKRAEEKFLKNGSVKNSPPETIQELRDICQRPDCIQRAVSIYFTKFFLKYTSISPTQVTIFDFFVGLVGCLLFFQGSNLTFVLGGIFLQLFQVFDCVDGEVARYLKYTGKLKRTKQEEAVVEFIQDIIHPILQPLMYLGFSYGLYLNYPHLIILILGFMAAVGSSVDTYSNILREKIIGSEGLKDASRCYKEMKSAADNMFSNIPLGRYLVEIVAFITPIPGVMAVLLLVSLADLVLSLSYPWNLKVVALIFYAFLQQILWLYNSYLAVKTLRR